MIQANYNGILTFASQPLTVPFKELFTVHVGCVAKKKSGVYDPEGELFASSKSNEGLYLRYKTSDKSDWIRPPNGIKTNLFCLSKTRAANPFFATPEKMQFDGAVLGLIPKDKCKQMFKSPKDVLDYLNNQPWDEIGFRNADGRFQVTQRALTEVWLVDRMVELN